MRLAHGLQVRPGYKPDYQSCFEAAARSEVVLNAARAAARALLL